MSDEDPPEDRPNSPSSAPPSTFPKEKEKESRRSRFEHVIPEIIKRAVELGVEKARESPENVRQFVQDMKVPKEVAHLIFQQLDDTKNGLFRVVAKEMRDFLEHTNIAGELQKLLTTVQFEVNTTIRFSPNDGREKSKDDDDDGGGGDGVERPAGDKSKDDAGSSSRQTLPKPEVKTSVRVHRDEHVRSRRRSRKST